MLTVCFLHQRECVPCVSDLDVEIVLLVLLAACKFGLVGLLVGPQVLSVPSDVGPGPHAADAFDVDLHDAVEGVLPPARGNTPQNLQSHILMSDM